MKLKMHLILFADLMVNCIICFCTGTYFEILLFASSKINQVT